MLLHFCYLKTWLWLTQASSTNDAKLPVDPGEVNPQIHTPIVCPKNNSPHL